MEDAMRSPRHCDRTRADRSPPRSGGSRKNQAEKTFRFCPFIGLERSDARKRIVSATSSAVMLAGAPPLTAAHIGVSTEPGLTALTRTPRDFTSTASALVSEITAPLLAQYETQPGNLSGPGTPEIDATLTIAPAPRSSIAGNARRQAR